jgi:hypothetical protein
VDDEREGVELSNMFMEPLSFTHTEAEGTLGLGAAWAG